MIGGAGAVLGYVAVYFALDAAKPGPVAPDAPAAPTEPVMLAQVVDVTDLEPLLDPPPGRPVGAPFEPDAAEPLAPTAAPVPIPPAADDEHPIGAEVAPMPHEALVRPALDPLRASWYGDEVFHRQVYEGLVDCTNRLNGAVGIGYFF